MSQNDFYRRKAKKIARRAVVLERRLERELDGEERIEKPREERIPREGRPVTGSPLRRPHALRRRALLSVGTSDLLRDASI